MAVRTGDHVAGATTSPQMPTLQDGTALAANDNGAMRVAWRREAA